MASPAQSWWRKTLKEQWRRISYIGGDDPSSQELEMMRDAQVRVGAVIVARWIILGVMGVYGIYAYLFFSHGQVDISNITSIQLLVPLLTFLAVAAYNAWYHYSYRWFSRIRSLNLLQLLFDMIFVSVVVHFSGGALSWFWTMYTVLTLEAALITDEAAGTYLVAAAGMLSYGAILTLEFYGVIAPVPMPFENNALQRTFSYAMIKWAWVGMTNFCIAFVAVYMMNMVRKREVRLRELVIKDALTNLYNRRYFFHRLNSEVQRAKRYGRTLSLIILDVDNFKAFNDTFGHLGGDALLRGLGDLIGSNIRRSDGEPSYEVDIACRYGGEEFAIILPEAATVGGLAAAERLRASIETRGAIVVAERIRRQIEKFSWEGRTVTVSVGLASYPDHGTDPEALVKAADDALYTAKRAGKNRVFVAGSMTAVNGRACE